MQDRQSRMPLKRKRPPWASTGSMARVLISWAVLCSLPLSIGANGDIVYQTVMPIWNNDTEAQFLPPPQENVTPLPTDSPRPSPSPSFIPSAAPSISFSPTTSSPTDTLEPSPSPSSFPTTEPTGRPSRSPTPEPTPSPTVRPTPSPTKSPTDSPTRTPTFPPTEAPTPVPLTAVPSRVPSQAPVAPTPVPLTAVPSRVPSQTPIAPTPLTGNPTPSRTRNPTPNPTPRAPGDPTLFPTFVSGDTPTTSPTKPTDFTPSPSDTSAPKPSFSGEPVAVRLEPFTLQLTFDSSARRRLSLRRRGQSSGSDMEAIAQDLEVTLASYLLESMNGYGETEGVELLDVVLTVTPEVGSQSMESRLNQRSNRDNVFGDGRSLQTTTEESFLVEGDVIVTIAEDSDVTQEQLVQGVTEASTAALSNSEALTAYLQTNAETAALQSVSSAQADLPGDENGDDGPSTAAIAIGFSLVALAVAGLGFYGYVFWKKHRKRSARRKREREQGIYNPSSSTVPLTNPNQSSRAVPPEAFQDDTLVAPVLTNVKDDDSSTSSYDGLQSDSSETEGDQIARELKVAASMDRRAWEDYEEKRQLFDDEDGNTEFPVEYAMVGGVTLFPSRDNNDEGVEAVEQQRSKGMSPVGVVAGTRSALSFPYGDEDDPSVMNDSADSSDVFAGDGMDWSPNEQISNEREAEFDPAMEMLASLAVIVNERPPPSKDRSSSDGKNLRSSEAPSSAAVRMSPIAESASTDFASSAAIDRDSQGTKTSESTAHEQRSLQTVDMIREVDQLALYIKRYERKREKKSREEELERAESEAAAPPEVGYEALGDSASAFRQRPSIETTSGLPGKLETGNRAKSEADRLSSWSTESNSGFLERESDLFFSSRDAAREEPPSPVWESNNPLKAAKALLSRFQNDERFHPDQPPPPVETPPSAAEAVGSPTEDAGREWRSVKPPLSPAPRPATPRAKESPPQAVSSEISSGYQSTDLMDNTSKTVVLKRAQDKIAKKQTRTASSSRAGGSRHSDDGRPPPTPAQQKARGVFAARYGLNNTSPAKKPPGDSTEKEAVTVKSDGAESRDMFMKKYGLRSTPTPTATPQEEQPKSSRDEFVDRYGLKASKVGEEKKPEQPVENENTAAPGSRDRVMSKYGLQTQAVKSQPPQESIEVSHVQTNEKPKAASKRSKFLEKYGLRTGKTSPSLEPVEISHHVDLKEPRDAAPSQARTVRAVSRSESEESEASSDESRLGITPFSVQKIIAPPVLGQPAPAQPDPPREEASPAPEVARPPVSTKKDVMDTFKRSIFYNRGQPTRTSRASTEETPEQVPTDGEASMRMPPREYDVSPERVPVRDEPPAKRTRETIGSKQPTTPAQRPPAKDRPRGALATSRRKRSLASLRQNDGLIGTGSDSVTSMHAPSDESWNRPNLGTPRNPRVDAEPRSKTPKSSSKISGILSAFESKPPNPIFPSGEHWQYQGK